MKNLTKFALKRPVTLVMGLITILFFGLQSILGSPMELTPDMEMPMMVVLTTYPGASPDDIFELVTKEVEDGVSTLSGIDNVTSQSMENASMVLIQYDYGTNMDTAYLDLKKSLDQVAGQLPDDVDTPVIYEIDMNSRPVMQIAISGGTDGSLYDYVDQTVVPEFEKILSVGDVSVTGGQSDYIKISLKPEKMAQYGLNMNTIASLVKAADFAVPAGNTHFGNQELNVSVGADYKNLDSIKNIVLPISGGVIHLL